MKSWLGGVCATSKRRRLRLISKKSNKRHKVSTNLKTQLKIQTEWSVDWPQWKDGLIVCLYFNVYFTLPRYHFSKCNIYFTLPELLCSTAFLQIRVRYTPGMLFSVQPQYVRVCGKRIMRMATFYPSSFTFQEQNASCVHTGMLYCLWWHLVLQGFLEPVGEVASFPG